jgi:hypothetical protein
MLSLIAALSLAQASGVVPQPVAADNTIVVQIPRAVTSTESFSASATAEIDLDNGQITVKLQQATPLSVYAVLLVSESLNLQIGNLVTDAGGGATLQATLNSGAYVGMFQITKLNLVQFASVDVSFTIGAASASATSTVESSSQSSTISSNNTAQVQLHVEPASVSISAGDFAKFDVHIAVTGSASIFLVARDVPPSSVAIYTPSFGVANPDFHSTLTIVTSPNAPSGSYEITVAATINGQELTSQVALQVSTPTTTQNTATATTSPNTVAALTVAVTTDEPQYQPNSTVTVQGHVTDIGGDAVTDATMSIQVDSPTGAEVFFTSSAQTDATGTFQSRFDLRGYVALGTYTVFASATKPNYVSAASRTTFVVGSSTTPSIIISSIYSGDSSGNPLATFSIGQTVWVWVVVQNVGATFQGVIWVQVKDPNGVPIEILIHITNFHAGETSKDGFTLQSNVAAGVYHVDALVSDKLISQGGTFLANAQTQFVVTG